MHPQKEVELSIVVPVYNEELIIDELKRRLIAAAESVTPDYEIIFVNDGSRDSSLQQLKTICKQHDRLFYISFSRNFGHQIAISAGMDFARGNAIVTIDGDLQDPPELIAAMYAQFKEGYKVIYAKRSKRIGESWFKLVTAKMFYRLMARLVSFDIPLDVGDYRMISRDVLEYVKKMKEYDKYLRGQIAWLGFKSTYVLFERDERKFGKTNYPFKKMLRLAFNGITAFSDSPLKIATSMGFTVCFIFAQEKVLPGWASTIVSITFIGGVQLLCLGLIGEYISRIINNVRNRPLYVIDETTATKKED
jgi:dolichol-phosphate mannosyltransferase